MPHAGVEGDGGQVERLVGGGDEDLSLVVVGDQNTFSSGKSSGEY